MNQSHLLQCAIILLLLTAKSQAEGPSNSPSEWFGASAALSEKVKDHAPLTSEDGDLFYRLLADANQGDSAVSITNTRPTESVLPLFQKPSAERGNIFRLFGTVSRIRRVEINDPAIRVKAKIDHYFEVDFVTTDSQGNPLVGCVTNLPAGMAETEDCCEPIEITAVFFKLWQYPTTLDEIDPIESAEHKMALQSAPLLIGQTFKSLKSSEKPEKTGSGLVIGLLVLGTIGLAMLLWGTGQVDRDFFQNFILRPTI